MNKYTPNNTNVSNDMHDMACGAGDSIMSPKELVLLLVFAILTVTATATVTIALDKQAYMMSEMNKCIEAQVTDGTTRIDAGELCGENK